MHRAAAHRTCSRTKSARISTAQRELKDAGGPESPERRWWTRAGAESGVETGEHQRGGCRRAAARPSTPVPTGAPDEERRPEASSTYWAWDSGPAAPDGSPNRSGILNAVTASTGRGRRAARHWPPRVERRSANRPRAKKRSARSSPGGGPIEEARAERPNRDDRETRAPRAGGGGARRGANASGERARRPNAVRRTRACGRSPGRGRTDARDEAEQARIEHDRRERAEHERLAREATERAAQEQAAREAEERRHATGRTGAAGAKRRSVPIARKRRANRKRASGLLGGGRARACCPRVCGTCAGRGRARRPRRGRTAPGARAARARTGRT